MCHIFALIVTDFFFFFLSGSIFIATDVLKTLNKNKNKIKIKILQFIR